MTQPAGARYAAFYCEENVYHLVAERRARGLDATVALVTNPTRSVAMWNVRAAEPGRPVAWDYHVIALDRDGETPGARGVAVHDPDSRLGCPLPLADYLRAHFAPPGLLPPRFRPRFRWMPGADYLAGFWSDRSHMRSARGRYRQPPPPWPAIVRPGAPSFLTWLDEDAPGPGVWLDPAELLARALGG